MKNPKTRQPDQVSGTVAHDGVDKPMNNNLGTDDIELNKENNDSVVDALTDTDEIDLNK